MTSKLVGMMALAVAGCPASDDAVELDAATASGVVVTWGVAPAVPGPVSADLELDQVELRFSSLRVIGDSAPPGDVRTTRGTTALQWDADRAPADVELLTAPPGVYARLELGVGGDDEKLEIHGRARIGGTWYRFEIEDERQHPVTLAQGFTLVPGARVTLPVGIATATLLAAVPFDEGLIVGDQLLIDDDDLDGMWAALDSAVAAGVVAITR